MHEDDPDFWSTFLFTDEASFSMNGHVATNTVCRYSDDGEGRPEDFIFEKGVDKRTITIWSGFHTSGLKLPLYRIEGNLNSLKYVDILQNHILPFLQQHNLHLSTIFQQDGAPGHTARYLMLFIFSYGL